MEDAQFPFSCCRCGAHFHSPIRRTRKGLRTATWHCPSCGGELDPEEFPASRRLADSRFPGAGFRQEAPIASRRKKAAASGVRFSERASDATAPISERKAFLARRTEREASPPKRRPRAKQALSARRLRQIQRRAQKVGNLALENILTQALALLASGQESSARAVLDSFRAQRVRGASRAPRRLGTDTMGATRERPTDPPGNGTSDVDRALVQCSCGEKVYSDCMDRHISNCHPIEGQDRPPDIHIDHLLFTVLPPGSCDIAQITAHYRGLLVSGA